MLTKGNFTRDEWNNLLHLFNINHFSSVCCSQNFSSTSCPETMAKRMQEVKGEERIVAKSKPTLNLVSHAATSSSSVNSPIASRCPGILKAPSRHIGLSGRPGVSAEQNSNPDAASSSQGWQRSALLHVSKGRLVGPGYQGYPENPQTTEDSEDSEPESRIWPHHFRKSPHLW